MRTESHWGSGRGELVTIFHRGRGKYGVRRAETGGWRGAELRLKS